MQITAFREAKNVEYMRFVYKLLYMENILMKFFNVLLQFNDLWAIKYPRI